MGEILETTDIDNAIAHIGILCFDLQVYCAIFSIAKLNVFICLCPHYRPRHCDRHVINVMHVFSALCTRFTLE